MIYSKKLSVPKVLLRPFVFVDSVNKDYSLMGRASDLII